MLRALMKLLLPAPFAPTSTFTSFNASAADRIDVNPSTTTDFSRLMPHAIRVAVIGPLEFLENSTSSRVSQASRLHQMQRTAARKHPGGARSSAAPLLSWELLRFSDA
jgi:hypothetical protein